MLPQLAVRSRRYADGLDLDENVHDPQLRDDLAIDRTKLANERTLLAYIRTSLALFLTGISGVHLPGLGEGTSFGPGYRVAGWVFIAAAALVMSIGYRRYRSVRRRMRNNR